MNLTHLWGPYQFINYQFGLISDKMAEKESVNGNKFEEIKEQMISSDSNTIGIAVALLVGLVTLILIFVWTRRRSLGRG